MKQEIRKFKKEIESCLPEQVDELNKLATKALSTEQTSQEKGMVFIEDNITIKNSFSREIIKQGIDVSLDDQKAKIIEIVEKTGEDDMLKDYNGVYINFVKIGIRLYKAKVVNNILKEFEEL